MLEETDVDVDVACMEHGNNQQYRVRIQMDKDTVCPLYTDNCTKLAAHVDTAIVHVLCSQCTCM